MTLTTKTRTLKLNGRSIKVTERYDGTQRSHQLTTMDDKPIGAVFSNRWTEVVIGVTGAGVFDGKEAERLKFRVNRSSLDHNTKAKVFRQAENWVVNYHIAHP
jgi:hypothetical protein